MRYTPSRSERFLIFLLFNALFLVIPSFRLDRRAPHPNRPMQRHRCAHQRCYYGHSRARREHQRPTRPSHRRNRRHSCCYPQRTSLLLPSSFAPSSSTPSPSSHPSTTLYAFVPSILSPALRRASHFSDSQMNDQIIGYHRRMRPLRSSQRPSRHPPHP